MFEREGGIFDGRHAAEHAAELLFSMRQSGTLVIVRVQAIPIRNSDCPLPLAPAECITQLAPEQLPYQITIDLANVARIEACSVIY